ncbi:MAG: rhodanese-like domain-containing protein [Akkermansiaceae bacterium]
MKLKTVLSALMFSLVVPASVSHGLEPKAAKASATEVVDLPAAKIEETLKKDPKIVIIDIRTPKEFAEGHLQGAKNIDFNGGDFKAKLNKLDKSKTYMMHCRSGGRSTESLKVWKELGFKKVIHLNKGILEMQEAKIPLVKGKPDDTKPEPKKK